MTYKNFIIDILNNCSDLDSELQIIENKDYLPAFYTEAYFDKDKGKLIVDNEYYK